ncbi:MAG TPA: response regulator transcription factor [Armatimonadota bacterium]|jgi:DNA-binding response OmpR family regulator
MRHILVVEDNTELARCVRQFLGAAGFEVTVAEQVAAARSRLAAGAYDLIILDLMLPDGEGLDLAREVRAAGDTPLIVASARGNGADRMLALECGADMYLAKPYEMEELRARVVACLRRYGSAEAEVLACGNLHLEAAARQVSVGRQPLALAPKEFELLAELLREKNRIVPQSELLWKVWGYSDEVRTRTLDVHLARLRAKLAHAGAQGFAIVTAPGAGYGLRPED